MKILMMQVTGKMAHFRKYYANNTALSYFIPPRTSLMGMLAAICGYEKDTYYEYLSSEHIRIGVGIQNPVKKTFHRLNLLKIKGMADFRGKQGRIQTPFEVVTGHNIGQNMVTYAVYVSYLERGITQFELLVKQLQGPGSVYSLTLGPANMLGFISAIQVFEGDQIEEVKLEDAPIELSTAVNSSQVSSLNWEKDRKLMIEEELTPSDFKANHDRELGNMVRLLYTTDGRSLPINYTGTCWRLGTENHTNITFIE